MRIIVVTPAARGTLHGNRTTASRWAAHWRALGHRVRILTSWQGEQADLLVALHAKRSHRALADWKAAFPGAPAVLVLTGTDLYRDLPDDAEARASLTLADRIVVLQDEAATLVGAIDPAAGQKTSVIYQSVKAVRRLSPPRRFLLATEIGHLRDEKDPLRPALALRRTPPSLAIQLVQLGMAMTPDYAAEAQALSAAEPRYRWLGLVPHATAMRWLGRSHLVVMPSRMEGGAHVVSEAIAAGVPVLASDIPGNRGLLGPRYAGYFPVGDEAALAVLLQRACHEPRFLAQLETEVAARRALVDPATEREALARLIAPWTASSTQAPRRALPRERPCERP